MIWSTSRPWKPTSVNLVASTLMKGASESFAMRRAISVCCSLRKWYGRCRQGVHRFALGQPPRHPYPPALTLPQPVGPIMRMFLGITSPFRSSGSLCRRHRFRSAMATARFASA